jgi:hypothetical protein
MDFLWLLWKAEIKQCGSLQMKCYSCWTNSWLLSSVLSKTLKTKNWKSNNMFEKTKILLHERNFTQHHHLEKWCWYSFIFSQKALFFSTGHLTSKLWMFTVQICLKIIYWKPCIWWQWFLRQDNALPLNADVTTKMPAKINKRLHNTEPTVQT